MNTLSRRKLVLIAGGGIAALMLCSAVRAQTGGTPARRNKLIIQVSDSDPAKWSLALNNARNVQLELGEDDVDMEIVVYGPGLPMLKAGSPMAQRVSAALKTGVKVVACENTMRAQHLVYADMLPDIGYVPAGVVELMQKQQQGYAYIRP